MMITRIQYKFLIKFIKLSKKNNKSNTHSINKLQTSPFAELLNKYPLLNQANPFNNDKNSGDYLEGTFLNTYIDSYLDEIGLAELIINNNSEYEITQKGLYAIDEYKREHRSQTIIPIVSLAILAISLLISIISIIIKIKK